MADSASSNSGRTVLITGASGGIGEALAWQFAAQGFGGILVARRQEPLAALAQAISARHGVAWDVMAADLALPDAPARLASALRERNRTVDILVNNAGVGLTGAFTDTDWRRERDMLQINVTALTELTKLLLPGMVQRRRGRILNVASTAGFVPGPLMAVYYASKAYVVDFSAALSNELRGTGVTVTALCPGPTRTGFDSTAGAGDSRLFRWFAGDVRAVAHAGMRGTLAGKTIVAPGWLAKLVVATGGIGPRGIAAALARFLNAPA